MESPSAAEENTKKKGVFHMFEKIKGLFIKYKEVIMYLVFGVATTLVNWITTFICQNVFGLKEQGFQTILSNGIAWFTAVLFAFLTNRKFVFESTAGNFWIEMVKFYLARAFTGLFEIFLPDGLVFLSEKVPGLGFLGAGFAGINGGVAKLVTSVIVIILNYILSKLVVFRKKKTPASEEK